jgi:hypothetical protein
MKFLEKTSILYLALPSFLGNRVKLLFCSVLCNKLHHRTNLTPLMISNLGFGNKTTSSGKFKIIRVFSYKFQILNVPSSVQYDESIHAPDFFSVSTYFELLYPSQLAVTGQNEFEFGTLFSF